ncbi:MAG: peptide deformylase [Clostridia bacterium]|nr:peptide deformylase [Clostridia bacterium]
MVREIIHDPIFLAVKSTTATKEDLSVATDLIDTLSYHQKTCVGMAANMIGVTKRIIAFVDQSDAKGVIGVMLNPEIISRSNPYEAQEECLSLIGTPKTCKRYKTIRVLYYNFAMQKRSKTFTGLTAQIIQHQIDHCDGILI